MVSLIIVAAIIFTIIISLIMAATKHHVSPKSAFLHLFMIAMLFASVIAAITLLFQYVNLVFPDVLKDSYLYARSSVFNSINMASAILIVAFPLLVYTSYVLEQSFRAHPAERDVVERKWLLYLTQFVTSITIVISLMSLIYNFYSGDLTIQFGLKVVAVLLVAGATLGYYRWDLRREGVDKSRIPMLMAVVLGVLLVAALVGGFFIGASPMQQRAVRFDEVRTANLGSIQSEVVSYWQTKKVLPAKLDDLNNTLTGFIVPKDPATDAAYEYTVKSDLQFEVCATFAEKSWNYDKEKSIGNVIDSRSAQDNGLGVSYPSYGGYDPNRVWLHEAGRYCFTRTIDPDAFKTPEVPVAEPAVK